MKTRLLAAFLALGLSLSAAAKPIESFQVMVPPGIGLSEAAFKTMVSGAIKEIESSYLPFFADVGKAPALSLSLFLTDGAPKGLSFTARASGQADISLFCQWNDPAELKLLLAPIVFSAWAGFAGLDRPIRRPPSPSLELGLNEAGAALGWDPALRHATVGLASGPDGGLFLSSVGLLAELKADFSLRQAYGSPANELLMYMDSSASGSLAAISSSGDGYFLRRGSTGMERGARIGNMNTGIRADDDGKAWFFDASALTLAYAKGMERGQYRFKGPKPGYISAFDFDDDGSLWIYDIMGGFLKRYGADGALAQVIRALPVSPSFFPMRMTVRGSVFIVSSTTAVAAYDRFGLPQWYLERVPNAMDLSVKSVIASVDVASDGAILVVSSMDGILTRLDDEASISAARTARGDAEADALASLAAANRRLLDDPGNRAALAERGAMMRDGRFSLGVRMTYLDGASRLDPADRSAREALAALRKDLARSAALAKAEALHATLARYGAETARPAYQAVMSSFERILAEDPGDQAAAKAMKRLGEAFKAKEAGVSPPAAPSLKLEAAFLPIFPAFAGRYRTMPAGKVILTNAGTQTETGIVLTAEMKSFMDFPARFEVKEPLKPGAKVELPITLVLNRTVLELREDVAVQLAIAAASENAYGTVVLDLTLRSRSALTWEDSAALAAFVTPQDDTIVAFAHAALAFAPPSLFGRAHSKAFGIVSALAARGFVYVEDPASPFSTSSGGNVVDTVRFPRVTLANGAGDCDDTTALVASCLEAAGIPCAILTSPGHVFMAYRSEGPFQPFGKQAAVPDARADFGFVEREGAYWVPLETTILSKGYAEAWKQGWAIAKAQGEALELIPLARARQDYPGMPLPGSPAMPPIPDRAGYDKAAGPALSSLKAAFADPLEKAAAGRPAGKEKANALNDWGVRLCQLGYFAAGIDAFRKAVSENSSMAAARVNLVLALKAAGKPDEAGAALKEALKALPAAAAIKRLAEQESGAKAAAASGGGETGARGSKEADFEFLISE